MNNNDDIYITPNYEPNSNTNITRTSEFTIPSEGVESIKSIDFGTNSSLDSIGRSAFANTGLTSINIPAFVTSIGEDVFKFTRSTKRTRSRW